VKIDIFQIDAFADKMFSGSTSAVCPLKDWIDESLMQNIAFQINLSKTAFIVKKESSLYEIRWFTPENEITLYEHAAVASAYVIFNYLDTKQKNITLRSLGNDIEISKEGDYISSSFNSNMPTLYTQSNPIFSLAMGIDPLKILKDKDYILIFENEETIKKLKPKIEVLRSLDLRGICIAARGDNNDFVFRYFAPKLGVDEDLIINSLCSQLAPYWSKVLNKNELKAVQISNRRSEIICNVADGKVIIKAKATLFMKGEIIIEERVKPRDKENSKSKLAIAV